MEVAVHPLTHRSVEEALQRCAGLAGDTAGPWSTPLTQETRSKLEHPGAHQNHPLLSPNWMKVLGQPQMLSHKKSPRRRVVAWCWHYGLQKHRAASTGAGETLSYSERLGYWSTAEYSTWVLGFWVLSLNQAQAILEGHWITTFLKHQIATSSTYLRDCLVQKRSYSDYRSQALKSINSAIRFFSFFCFYFVWFNWICFRHDSFPLPASPQ